MIWVLIFVFGEIVFLFGEINLEKLVAKDIVFVVDLALIFPPLPFLI